MLFNLHVRRHLTKTHSWITVTLSLITYNTCFKLLKIAKPIKGSSTTRNRLYGHVYNRLRRTGAFKVATHDEYFNENDSVLPPLYLFVCMKIPF